MSGTGTSPLASSTEKTNGAKLSRLLIDGGTTVLRSVFDSYHPPAHLVPDLNANKPKLVSLLRKKVLNKSQWEKLFPASGRAAPDSNTFDITLLFLLLTNICGLSPPPTGWHSKPPQSDISHEANLARVKFFRNKLYGHVATTGVDTATFNALWPEISGVLVALGLGQAEIDRLKVEYSGEEDYLDALRDWAESEEDIKSQLKDISQSQITTQQIVGENKSKLEELHQSERETRQLLTEVLEGQQEDHGRIQQSISKLGLIHQTEIEIDQTVQELNQMHREDRKTLQDTNRKVDKLSEAHFEASQTVSKVLKTQEEHLETLQELQRTFEDSKGRQSDNQDQILKKLARVDPQNDVKYYAERHLEGTRDSIFAKVKNWLDDRNSPNRVMVISANPGMGKSVVAAVICKRMQVAGRLLGSHFCRHDKARHRNPKVMLQSLAYHLSSCLPEYKKALVEQLSRNLGVEINNMEIGELFELLLEEPLSRHPDPGFTYLVVIDALDESEYQGRNELVDVVGKYFSKLPLWVRFLVTTRPEINISESLRELQPLQLQPNSEDNLKDIRLYLQQRLSDVLPAQSREVILNGLVEKSEGVILCAQFLVDSIKNNFSTRSLEQLDSTLPKGISFVYNSYFKRLETELCKELKITEDHFFGFLSAITAAREPLPLGFVSKLLFSGKSWPALQRKVRNAIGCISSLLPIQDERIHFFHKSVKDWLTGKSNYGQHSFSVEEGEGHCILSRLCIEEYDDIKTRGVVSSQQFSDTAKYSLKHGVEHMLQVDEGARSCNLEELANRYVIDIELVYAKLCVNSFTAIQDVGVLTKQQEWDALSVPTQRSLETFLCILRGHRTCLEEHPSTVFQMVLNEGGPQLSSEASELLGNRYSDIPYMEYLDKKDLQGAVETEFHCSSQVACVDVSPQSEYMVCECKDGTIQLWSLLTGMLMWKRGVIKKKRYYPLCHAFRMVKLGPDLRRLPFQYPAWSMSYFRSVVFHSNKELILPGVLSHAYLFNGELISLFPESNCSFSTCSMSGDRIITDCPDDAKCLFMWSLEDGTEITRVTQEEDVLSFSWSTDRRLLAVSHCSGSLCVLDAMNGFKTLIKTSTPDVCGMINFSPDRRFLFCWPLITYMNDEDSHDYARVVSGVNTFLDLHLSLGDRENVSLVAGSLRNGDFKPWEFESRSEVGFMLGDIFCRDPVSIYHPSVAFVPNKQSVLTSSPYLDLITRTSIDKLRNDRNGRIPRGFVSLFFSFNGETLYAIENSGTEISISCWDVSSGDLKEWGCIVGCFFYVVPVRDGLLLKRRNPPTLELWNLELFHCIRQWDSIMTAWKPIPISDQHVYVACQGSEQAIILDTSTDDTITTISPFLGRLVALSSRWQLITFNDGRLLSIQNPIWEVCWPIPGRQVSTVKGIFSPAEQFLVIYGKFVGHQNSEDVVDVVDALSGNTLHTLPVASDVKGCKFVGDEECAILSYDSPGGLCLQLFNVRSGEPISVMDFKRDRQERPSLASCLRKGLIAIGPLANEKFKVIQVKLPRKSKDSDRK